MRTLPHLAATVYVGGARGTAVPLFGVGTPLPAVRRHTLPGPQSRQASLDLHVLYGGSAAAPQNRSLGHWRISGARPADRAGSHLRIQFLVDAAGNLELAALQDRVPLLVTPLDATDERLPIDPAGIEPPSLVTAWERLHAGHKPKVQEELVTLLQGQPDNLAGWALLAAVADDTVHKADCYRQMLRLDPGNLAALAALQAIPPEEASTTQPDTRSQTLLQPGLREDGTLVCPQCGAVMEIRTNEEEEKHAFCPGCGATASLPASFRGAEIGSRPLDSAALAKDAANQVPVEDQPAPSQAPADPDQHRGAQTTLPLEDEDALIAEIVRSRLPQRAPVPTPKDSGLLSRLAHRLRREPPPPTLAAAGPDLQLAAAQDPLDPDVVLELAGGPLAAQERVQCPACGATVSRKQDRCPWCSAPLDIPDRSS